MPLLNMRLARPALLIDLARIPGSTTSKINATLCASVP
jgi:hypothetical protein